MSFYLKGLDKWRQEDYRCRAEAIRERAASENRYLTALEERDVLALERASFLCMMDHVLEGTVKQLESDAKTGKLGTLRVKMLKMLAERGVAKAQAILRTLEEARPKTGSRLNAVLEKLERTTDSEKALRLIQQLTPEEREEFRVLQEKRRNNLPAQPTALR